MSSGEEKTSGPNTVFLSMQGDPLVPKVSHCQRIKLPKAINIPPQMHMVSIHNRSEIRLSSSLSDINSSPSN